MVAAGFRYPAQPCSAAVADLSFANVALRMRAQRNPLTSLVPGWCAPPDPLCTSGVDPRITVVQSHHLVLKSTPADVKINISWC